MMNTEVNPAKQLAEIYDFAREACSVCNSNMTGSTKKSCFACGGRGWTAISPIDIVAWRGLMWLRLHRPKAAIAILQSSTPLESLISELLEHR